MLLKNNVKCDIFDSEHQIWAKKKTNVNVTTWRHVTRQSPVNTKYNVGHILLNAHINID